MQQKACTYCHTPAEPLATKCLSCGSALPVALPMPVAKLVEAQAHWTLRKTGFVSVGVTAVIAALLIFAESTFVGLLVALWLIFLLPGLMLSSAWMNANRKMGALLGNVLIAIGVWGSCIILLVIAIAISK